MKSLDIPAIPTATELKIMLILLPQRKGLSAQDIQALSKGAISAGSEHMLLHRLAGKGYVAATDDGRPLYRLTPPGRSIAAGFRSAFALM